VPTGDRITEADVPTYQYACKACGHQLEAVQSFTDEPLTECPACAGQLRKVFSSVGIVFKGSGFYRTDSRATPKKEKETVGATAGSTGSESRTSESRTSESRTSDAKASGAKASSNVTKPAAAA
jgi:putative FmdB family regulatory protein